MSESLLMVAALLVAGYLLLALEVFVVPGFGVPGLLGLLCLGAACYYAFRLFGALHGTLAVVAVLVLTTVVLVWFPKSRLGADIVHQGSLADSRASAVMVKPGELGEAESDLRPAGIARFGEHRESVVTDAEFVRRGTPVRVVEIEGSRVLVEVAENSVDGAPAAEPRGGS